VKARGGKALKKGDNPFMQKNSSALLKTRSRRRSKAKGRNDRGKGGVGAEGWLDWESRQAPMRIDDFGEATVEVVEIAEEVSVVDDDDR